jgi:4-amino-4-deoxy-L-arabinose transferase-like glycosyltransferase
MTEAIRDGACPKWPALAIFLGAFLLAAWTAGDYGVTWDEPPYFHASDLHIGWIAEFADNLVHGSAGKSLDDQRIQAAWHWDAYHVPHPPFSRIVSGVTHALAPPGVDKFVSYRLGPALFFALLAAVVYLWVAELFSRPAGLFAALSVGLIPNMFGFAHVAVTDMPLAAMWFVTAYCFWKGIDNWKWSVAFGIVWGLALATKFPALLIPAPLLLWAHIFRRDRYANNIMAMLLVSPIVMIATQPYLWHKPFMRILEFLYEGVSRGYRPETNYPVLFFGRAVYSDSLPKYYTFFLTAITTPETILALTVIGVLMLFRDRTRRATLALFAINALFILLLGSLPGAVLHDGMRQMLSVYAFMAALAGAGFYWLAQALGRRVARVKTLGSIRNAQAKAASALAVLLLAPPLIAVIVYHPFELSYYNRFVGGLAGAYARGLEPTYFMEAITPSFLQHLNEKLPQNAAVNGLFANFMLEYYQQQGKLRRDIKIVNDEPFDYTLVLNRRSALGTLAVRRQLDHLKNGQPPLASVSLAGVPLVMLYEAHPR